MDAAKKGQTLTYRDVVSVTGQVSDAKIARIIATGVTRAELEEALAYAMGEDDVMGKLRKPAIGRVAAVYEILMADEPFQEDEA